MNSKPAPYGFNFLGHITGSLGLGVSARNTLTALAYRRDPVNAIDIDPGYGRAGKDASFSELLASSTFASPYGVNLLHFNPPQVMQLMATRPHWLQLADRFNVSVPYWELPMLPVGGRWREFVSTVDVVLAPSRFVMGAVQASAPEARVLHYPQAVFLPEGVAPNRLRFGLPEDKFLILVSFDVSSDTSRKNPEAALAAFEAANLHDARLVVKLNNSNIHSASNEAARRLHSRLQDDERVILFSKDLSYEESLAFTASCDVYLSMHRSEGLGLNLLEAMSLGKAVVCTGWSGNMDFTGPENSCLVDYNLIPVEATHRDYRPSFIGPDQTWAEPCVDEAARWLTLLQRDPGMRLRIGANAASSMSSLRERFLVGRAFDEVHRMYEEREWMRDLPKRASAWSGLSKQTLTQKARTLASHTARRLGLRR